MFGKFSEAASWCRRCVQSPDTAWTGHWSSFPDGIVDVEDMHLSNVDMQITMWASEGRIDGTIATKSLCKLIPVFNYIPLRGEVFGDTANVVAWDIVAGQKTDFAELKLERDGDVITVSPTSGQKNWFPVTARLGRHPIKESSEPEPNQTFCSEERKVFFENQKSSTNSPYLKFMLKGSLRLPLN